MAAVGGRPTRILADVVIEIESSPEPEGVTQAYVASKTRAVVGSVSGSLSSQIKEKGRRRAASRSVKKASYPDTVIELTDSEDSELEMFINHNPTSHLHSQHKQVHHFQQTEPGPSNCVPRSGDTVQALQLVPGFSASLEDIAEVESGPIPGPSSKRPKITVATPLFLNSESEGETNPSFANGAHVKHEAVEPETKETHRVEAMIGKDNIQSNDKGKTRDKGKGRTKDVSLEGPKDEDNSNHDPEFSSKPFPNFFDTLHQHQQRWVGGTPQPPLFRGMQTEQAHAPSSSQSIAPVPTESYPNSTPNLLQQSQIQHIAPQVQVQQQPTQEMLQVPPVDPASHTISQILEMVPDVELEYLSGLVQEHLPNFGAQTVEHVVGILFESGGYPRVDLRKKGKRKAESESEIDRSNKKARFELEVDYGSLDRDSKGGPYYANLALIQLQTSFPLIPKPFLRKTLQEHKYLYAPTHLSLIEAEKTYAEKTRYHDIVGQAAMGNALRPYILKTTPYNNVKDVRGMKNVKDEEYLKERKWVVERLNIQRETERDTGLGVGPQEDVHGEVSSVATLSKGKERAVVAAQEEPAVVDDGTGIECQCCFSEYAFDTMVQCPEAHLFCTACVSQYAATKLGEHDSAILCMHSSGCALPFPVSELKRVLSDKLMALYERVQQQKELEAANLEGLEECPFCDWKCVLEISKEEEKLFRCGNEEGDCGIVSCRSCKKKDHLPKSCKEVEEDKVLDGRHAIEEAMTRALMRNCPKCKKPFIKDHGCNKMTCPNCRTLSCYICRKIIGGYDHFDQTPQGRPSSSKNKGKCPLFDPIEERHAAEVKAAAESALAEYKIENPDVNERDLEVDIPVAPPRPQVPGIPARFAGMAHGFRGRIPPPNLHLYRGMAQAAIPVASQINVNVQGMNPFGMPAMGAVQYMEEQHLPPFQMAALLPPIQAPIYNPGVPPPALPHRRVQQQHRFERQLGQEMNRTGQQNPYRDQRLQVAYEQARVDAQLAVARTRARDQERQMADARDHQRREQQQRAMVFQRDMQMRQLMQLTAQNRAQALPQMAAHQQQPAPNVNVNVVPGHLQPPPPAQFAHRYAKRPRQ